MKHVIGICIMIAIIIGLIGYALQHHRRDTTQIAFVNRASYSVTTPPYALLHTPTAQPLSAHVSQMPPRRDELGGGWLYNADSNLWTYYPAGEFLVVWSRDHPFYRQANPIDPRCPAHYRLIGWYINYDLYHHAHESNVCVPSKLAVPPGWYVHQFANHRDADRYLDESRKEARRSHG